MPLNLPKIEGVIQRYMLDEITINHPGPKTVDPGTLELTVGETEIYSGIAMVSPMGSAGKKMLGEGEYASTQYEIQIPLGDEDVQENDIVRIVSSRDEAFLLEGTVLIVRGLMPGTFSVARRIAAFLDRLAT